MKQRNVATGGGGRRGTSFQGRSFVPTVDFYQRVPRDLTEVS